VNVPFTRSGWLTVTLACALVVAPGALAQEEMPEEAPAPEDVPPEDVPPAEQEPEEVRGEDARADFGGAVIFVSGALIILGLLAGWWVRNRYRP
jgi:hypothetical protein